MSKTHTRGFTLVELVAATGIFVIALLGVYSLLQQALHVESRAARVWDDRGAADAIADHIADLVESAVDFDDMPGLICGALGDADGHQLICTTLSGGGERVRLRWGGETEGRILQQTVSCSGSRLLIVAAPGESDSVFSAVAPVEIAARIKSFDVAFRPVGTATARWQPIWPGPAAGVQVRIRMEVGTETVERIVAPVVTAPLDESRGHQG